MRVFQNVHMLLDKGICSFFKASGGNYFAVQKARLFQAVMGQAGGKAARRMWGGALPIGISQLGARRGGMQSLTGPGGIMIDQIQEKRMGPRLSVLGILALCLIFWAAFVTLVLNW